MDIQRLTEFVVSHYDDPASLTQVYVDLCETIAILEQLKKDCLLGVERYLIDNKLDRAENPVASFGITRPVPRIKVDEKAWERAVANNPELASLAYTYNLERERFAVEVVDKPRPYIKGKKL